MKGVCLGRLAMSVLGMLAFVAASAAEEQSSMAMLAERIRAELPQNWSVEYEPEDLWLEIRREEPTLIHSAIPGMSIGDTGSVETAAFAFRQMPYMSPGEWRRFKALDEELEKDRECLFDELRTMGVPLAKVSFAPRTEDHKRLVASYTALTESRQKLPDYSYRSISLTWTFPWWTDTPSTLVADKRIREECARVERKVLRLLSKYSKHTPGMERTRKGAELLMDVRVSR